MAKNCLSVPCELICVYASKGSVLERSVFRRLARVAAIVAVPVVVLAVVEDHWSGCR